ncbi:SDR family NAD(P)-dependent oxidoreductase [Amylibacter sp. SFDW26]|uniref:SDR family NAD(P)-dependent oxidoreductase n=1 Tax=Amylibacter sp. SFDW26 TaxID=2652722 RepID=UPI001261D5CB|nr:SDR family NAD(P)-dependent oxidoreductase [Amylibacter sp. SFDW26]KAB7613813.1 SDR family NAD(P)-dependent oxidoreductase [Amylibacter sp. SFDW26]
MATAQKKVLIIGASGGIGSALAELCIKRDYHVSTLSRRDDGIDITDESSIKAAADTIAGGLDMIVIATGVLEVDGLRPEKTIQSMTAEKLMTQFQINALGPALLLKYFTPKLTKSRRCVVMTLSARVGSIGDNHLGGWISYRSAKAALNQIIHTTAIELDRKNPNAICIAYHPGTVGTDLTKKYLKNRTFVAPKDAAQDLLNVADSLTPRDTGEFFDWAGKKPVW